MGASTVVGLALSLSLFIVRSAEGTGTCGQRKLAATALIAHGYKARYGAWPWHGAIFHRGRQNRTEYACGVTILTEQFVLTAAHCTYDDWQRLREDRVFIKVGLSNLESPEDHMRQFDINKIIRHEEYDRDSFENDIALLKLYNEMTFNTYIQPTCLWQGDSQLSKIISKEGIVVGWGLNEGYSLPERLNEATMPIVSRRDCIASDPYHYKKFYFELKTFCAGYRNGTNVNRGDSGGGLYMRMDANWVLRGFVSNIKTNPNTLKIEPDSYTIFTDVSYYISWIKTNVPDIPHIAVDTDQIAENESDANLLDLWNCGKDAYLASTPEEGYQMQYPWRAVIQRYDLMRQIYQTLCLGLLIHPSFLITTARCIHINGKRHISVRINELHGIQSYSTRIPVRDTFAHPDYDTPKYANDIALVKLEQPTSVNPICLPLWDPFNTSNTKKFDMVSLHMYEQYWKFQNVAQLVDYKGCPFMFTMNDIKLTRGQFCGTFIGEDDYVDDSYYLGPALMQYFRKGSFEGQYYLTAIASFGVKGGVSDVPTVFTNVAYYSKWIREKIEQN